MAFGNGGLFLSNLFFADGNFLFHEASPQDIDASLPILAEYKKLSGQKSEYELVINFIFQTCS